MKKRKHLPLIGVRDAEWETCEITVNGKPWSAIYTYENVSREQISEDF